MRSLVLGGNPEGETATFPALPARPGEPAPLDRHPAAVYLAHLAPGSRRTMRAALDVIARLLTSGRCDALTLDWSAVRYQHTAAVRSALAERYAPATANKALAALRGVLRQCWRLGFMSAEAYQRAADLPAVRGSRLPAGRALSRGELQALFASCAEDSRPTGARDAALLAILYGAGLRRSEAVALDLGDYERESGALTIRRGKGRRERVCYATNGAADALEAWLEVRGDEPGSLFVPIDKAGRLAMRRMTDQAILYVLRRRARRADVAGFSPHDLRRTFIGDLLDAGADIATVQQLAGHASVQTTARYDRRGETVKRKAAGMLHVPYAAANRFPHSRRSFLGAIPGGQQPPCLMAGPGAKAERPDHGHEGATSARQRGGARPRWSSL